MDVATWFTGEALWSWALTGTGLTGLVLAGRRYWAGWAIGLAVQVLWLAYAYATHQPGFYLSAVAYAVVYGRNMVRWRRDAREAEPAQKLPTPVDWEAATTALAHCIHELRCLPLGGPIEPHDVSPHGRRQAEADRTRARYLLMGLVDQGWALTPVKAGPAKTSETVRGVARVGW